MEGQGLIEWREGENSFIIFMTLRIVFWETAFKEFNVKASSPYLDADSFEMFKRIPYLDFACSTQLIALPALL